LFCCRFSFFRVFGFFRRFGLCFFRFIRFFREIGFCSFHGLCFFRFIRFVHGRRGSRFRYFSITRAWALLRWFFHTFFLWCGGFGRGSILLAIRAFDPYEARLAGGDGGAVRIFRSDRWAGWGQIAVAGGGGAYFGGGAWRARADGFQGVLVIFNARRGLGECCAAQANSK
jgi:hypothetical protein